MVEPSSPSASMHEALKNTNGGIADGPPRSPAPKPEETPMSIEIPIHDAANETPEGLAQSASSKAGEVTSQWGEPGTCSVEARSSSSPSTPLEGPLRQEPTAECIHSAKLADSGSSGKICQNPKNPVTGDGVCTKASPERCVELASYSDNEWLWFAVGAIAVAGAMFAGRSIYRSMDSGRRSSTAA